MAHIKRTSMSVMEMGQLLGLGKTDSYWLIKKNYFKTITVGNKMRVIIESFEEWYANQLHYKKVDGSPAGTQLNKIAMSVQELAQRLGICEASAYDLIGKGHFDLVPSLGQTHISRDSFNRWYENQTFYRTVEDQVKDASEMRNTYTMPEIARLLGVHRNTVYDLVAKDLFDTIQIGRRKCITKASFNRWYESQSHYHIKTIQATQKGSE